MPNEIKAWGCNHCSMTSRIKGNVVRHEKKVCKKNPNRPHCLSCVHVEFESHTPSCGSPLVGDYEPYEPEYWYCSLIETEDVMTYEDVKKTRECELFKLEQAEEV
jgi:hypothetical protein